MKKGKIFSLNLSKTKGVAKIPVSKVFLIENFGVEHDAHAGGEPLRQVSLLSIESIREQKECSKVRTTGLLLQPGDFAENITTEGINLANLKIGDRLTVGHRAVLEISKIGKECHRRCSIYYKIGDCIMPREGIFAQVIKGGEISVGDKIEINIPVL